MSLSNVVTLTKRASRTIVGGLNVTDLENAVNIYIFLIRKYDKGEITFYF
jgi:hypothetical protein